MGILKAGNSDTSGIYALSLASLSHLTHLRRKVCGNVTYFAFR
jgi:hypothetical protein